MATDQTRPLRSDLGFEDEAHPEAPAAPPAPLHKSGPAPFAVLLGTLGLLTALAVVLSEVADVSIPWSGLGPWLVVGGGLAVVLVGLLGMRASRPQD